MRRAHILCVIRRSRGSRLGGSALSEFAAVTFPASFTYIITLCAAFVTGKLFQRCKLLYNFCIVFVSRRAAWRRGEVCAFAVQAMLVSSSVRSLCRPPGPAWRRGHLAVGPPCGGAKCVLLLYKRCLFHRQSVISPSARTHLAVGHSVRLWYRQCLFHRQSVTPPSARTAVRKDSARTPQGPRSARYDVKIY